MSLDAITARLTKARAEANTTKNDASRAVYAIDRALEEIDGLTPPDTPTPPVEVGWGLPDFSGIEMAVWDWGKPFAPSEWGEPKLGGYDRKSANVRITGGKLELNITEKASAQVQANDAGLLTKARWEVDVTIPTMKPGLIAAPLWTYDSKGQADELDFEVVGTKGLTLTIWASVDGKKESVWDNGGKPIIPGDLSGKRYKLAIDYEAGKVVVFYIDDKEVARVTPADCPKGFPKEKQKAFIDLWVANGLDAGWAGKWTPLRKGHALTMTVHGFRQS